MDNRCFLIECSSFSSLQRKVSDLLQITHFEGEIVTYYDLEENTLEQVFEDLDTYSFLTPRKVVVITKALFLAVSEVKFDEKEINHLLKYLKSPSSDVLFIMGIDKCDERKKIVKEIKKLVQVIKVDENPAVVAKNLLIDYKIAEEALQLLLEFTMNDIIRLTNECEKLKLYTLESKTITKEDVLMVVAKNTPNIEQLAFDFVKYLANRDKKRIFECYEILKENKFEPHSMIGLIESQIKLIYQVLLGKRKNMSKDEIAKYLKEHPFRVQKTLEFLPLYQEAELQRLIHELHDLDYRIKSGVIDAISGFELFLVHI